jgi:hypothetical protein
LQINSDGNRPEEEEEKEKGDVGNFMKLSLHSEVNRR